MKHIFLNLKRFDISPEKGGVNRLAPMQNWGAAIVSGTQEALAAYDPSEVEFVMYMPEAHLLGAAAAKKAVEVEVAVKKVEGPIEEAKTEEEKKIFPILDAMGIEHVALACACEV